MSIYDENFSIPTLKDMYYIGQETIHTQKKIVNEQNRFNKFQVFIRFNQKIWLSQ